MQTELTEYNLPFGGELEKPETAAAAKGHQSKDFSISKRESHHGYDVSKH